ncbi:hypothetical protein HJG60_012235 [Phyllostomus discolor]|uniref:Uncharacterized protein n=1 Tax=Phyllostomus discolor TaxID=89673 RepID=A0A833Z6A3_9CHIR|nr:hypothetical protein HJG60_012235 [Phyllostomus discolor]
MEFWEQASHRFDSSPKTRPLASTEQASKKLASPPWTRPLASLGPTTEVTITLAQASGIAGNNPPGVSPIVPAQASNVPQNKIPRGVRLINAVQASSITRNGPPLHPGIGLIAMAQEAGVPGNSPLEITLITPAQALASPEQTSRGQGLFEREEGREGNIDVREKYGSASSQTPGIGPPTQINIEAHRSWVSTFGVILSLEEQCTSETQRRVKGVPDKQLEFTDQLTLLTEPPLTTVHLAFVFSSLVCQNTSSSISGRFRWRRTGHTSHKSSPTLGTKTW